MYSIFHICVLTIWLAQCATGFLEPGKWSFPVTQKSCHYFQVHKALYKSSVISIKIICDPNNSPINTKIKIGWVVRQSPCFEEYLGSEVTMPDYLKWYYHCPVSQMGDFGYSEVTFLKKNEIEVTCNHIVDQSLTEVDPNFLVRSIGGNDTLCSAIDEKRQCDSSPPPPPISIIRGPDVSERAFESNAIIKRMAKRNAVSEKPQALLKTPKVVSTGRVPSPDHQIIVPNDGVYLLVLRIVTVEEKNLFDATVDIEMRGEKGYLSAVEWPLLPFYGVMCVVYVFFALAWLVVAALQWRDLLRIQFWIGGVILLGMIEKAVFYAEHSAINSTGLSVKGAVLSAELLSCLKRTLARMLVIVVSLGFGIVKPRLGPMLNRVVCVGGLYFFLGSIEAILRIYKPKNDPTNQTLMAGVPLAVLDSIICWWVFSSLVQTTRTLRLRRNLVKLNLYRQFTSTLICAVLGSIVFMVWQIHNHKLTSCLSDWSQLWIDDAYWHVLFSIVLLVIMVLWRPTNNNQRYAFTPLLDASDDEENDLINQSNDAFDGMKMRQQRNSISSNHSRDAAKDPLLGKETEEDLKWIEEHIPSSFVDAALPALVDSDEEIMTTRFERNKME